MPEFGEGVRVRARATSVVNLKEGIRLWKPGDEADVTWSHFWEGQLGQGAITLVGGRLPVVPPCADEKASVGKGRRKA